MNEVKVATFDPFHGNFYSANFGTYLFYLNVAMGGIMSEYGKALRTWDDDRNKFS